MKKIGDYFKAKILKKKIKKASEPSKIEKTIDELLAEELKNVNATRRTTDKLLKLKLMRRESDAALRKVQELDEEDDDYEEDEKPSLEDQLVGPLISKLLGVPNPTQQNSNPAAAAFGEVLNGPSNDISSQSGDRVDLHEMLDKLPTDTVNKLREMF